MKNKCKFERNKEKEYVSVHEKKIEINPTYIFITIIVAMSIIFAIKVFFPFLDY